MGIHNTAYMPELVTLRNVPRRNIFHRNSYRVVFIILFTQKGLQVRKYFARIKINHSQVTVVVFELCQEYEEKIEQLQFRFSSSTSFIFNFICSESCKYKTRRVVSDICWCYTKKLISTVDSDKGFFVTSNPL